MPVSITSNLAAATARQNITDQTNRIDRSLAKLSSGRRVFSAEEDAAALAVGTGLRVDVSALRSAQINAAQGVAMLQIADGTLARLSEVLVRMKSLTSQALSDQISDTERGFVDQEYQALLLEIDRMSASTEFNGLPLLGGSTNIQLNTIGANVNGANGFVGHDFRAPAAAGDTFEVDFDSATNVMTITNATQTVAQSITVQSPQTGQLVEYTFNQLGLTLTLSSDFNDTANIVHAGAGEEFDVLAAAVAAPSLLDFQIGTGTATSDRITVTLPVTNTTAFNLAGTDLLNKTNAQTTSGFVDAAITTLNTTRAIVGSNMSRLEFAGDNITVAVENSESAKSALLDVNVAQEITELTSRQVLLQSGLEMLSQANQRPEILLRLLQS